MKLVILGFQQAKLLELNLLAEDAIMLRTLKDMVSSSRMEKQDDYTWIKLDYLVEQIPIIGKKRFIQMRLAYYEKIGLIEKKIIHNFHGIKGSFHMIRLLPKLDILEDYVEEDHVQTMHHPSAKHAHTPCKTCTTPMHSLHTKDSSLNYSSVKDINNIPSENNDSEEKTKNTFQKQVFEEWVKRAKNENALVNHIKYSLTIEKAINKAIRIYGKDFDKFKLLIDRFINCFNKAKDSEYPIRSRPIYEFFGQKVKDGVILICQEYDDDGSKWLRAENMPKKRKTLYDD